MELRRILLELSLMEIGKKESGRGGRGGESEDRKKEKYNEGPWLTGSH